MTTTTKVNCLKRWTTTVGTTAVFAVIGTFVMPMAFAETNIGKHSKSEIRSACNAAGGDLLGVSDAGSYGCEVASTGALILCNKEESCTAFTPVKTKPNPKNIVAFLNPKARSLTTK